MGEPVWCTRKVWTRPSGGKEIIRETIADYGARGTQVTPATSGTLPAHWWEGLGS